MATLLTNSEPRVYYTYGSFQHIHRESTATALRGYVAVSMPAGSLKLALVQSNVMSRQMSIAVSLS